MGWGEALSGIGGGLESAMSTWQFLKSNEMQDKRLQTQLDIEDKRGENRLQVNDARGQIQQIIQELKNSGMLQQIDARGTQDRQTEGVKQEGRIDLSGVNFGHSMDLAEFNQGAADTRNIRDNSTRRYGIDTGAGTTRRGQDISAGTARRGQDLTAGTSRRGQDLSFGASTFATDSANRRATIPRPNTAMPFGGVSLPTTSYDKLFTKPPTVESPTGPGPAAPVAPPAAPAQAPGPQAAAPPAPSNLQSQVQVGKRVTLRDGRTVTVDAILPNGQIQYH